jgi:hypothetical protein
LLFVRVFEPFESVVTATPSKYAELNLSESEDI